MQFQYEKENESGINGKWHELVLVKKQISVIMADLSWGHINIFRGDTRGLCFSWYTRGPCSQGKELINHNLNLFAWPLKFDYGWPFVNNAKIKKYIYSHSTKYICTQDIILHPATVYLCSFKELHLFNFKEMIYLLIVKEINSFKEHIFIHQKCITIRDSYILSWNYIHFKEVISSFKEIYPRSRKINSFREIISIQGDILT